MGKKIIQVEVRERSPWGESVEDDKVANEARQSTFIPGYSDARAQFEREVALGNDPKPLRHRFQFARKERPDGTEDGRRIAQWKSKGYTKVKWDEAVAAGYDLDNSACQRGPDDSVLLGDTVLMWTPAPNAARRAKQIKEDTKAASDAYQKRVEDAVEDANKKMGRKAGARGATAAIFELERADGT